MPRRLLPLTLCLSIASAAFPGAAQSTATVQEPPGGSPGPVTAPADSGERSRSVAIFANLGVEKMLGHTKYRIHFGENVPDVGYVFGESELKFPLEVLLAGFDLRVGSTSETRRSWAVALGLRKRIHDPVGTMEDSDWVGAPAIGFLQKLSFTESDADADALILDLKGHIALLESPSFSLNFMLGYMYQEFSYEIFGVSGWQLDDELQRFYFDVFEGVNVLDYDVSFKLPYFGVSASLGGSSGTSLEGEFAFSPRASANDRDDHILRGKLSEAQCTGIAFTAGANATWTFVSSAGGPSWWLGFGGELLSTSTDGKQVQFFYADDPGSEGDETGLMFRGIDDKISSRQYKGSVQFGARF